METIKKVKTIGFAIVTAALITSCSETVLKEEHDLMISNLESDNQTRLDSLNDRYIATLNDIDQNLDEIRYMQGILIVNPKTNGDYGVAKKDQILNNINAINGLLAQNKIKLAELEKNLEKFKKGRAELQKAMDFAKKRVEKQEVEIQELKQTLVASNCKIEELNQTVAYNETVLVDLKEKNKVQKQALERKYFAYGTQKQLADKKLLADKKGLNKLFGKNELSGKLNKDEFSTVNMYQDTVISMIGKNAKLISNHPVDSYTIEANSDNLTQLTITNPDEFWKASNYLIVQVKN